MSTAAPKKWDVFLSYHGCDRPEAKQVEEMLTAAGLSVWFDKHFITAGDAWLRVIEEAIEEVSVFLVLLTDHAPQGWVRAEVDLALIQRNRLHRTESRADSAFRIIPLIAEEFDPGQLDPLLGRFQSLTLPADAAHRQNVLAELADDLKKGFPNRPADPLHGPLSDSSAATLGPFPGLLHFDEDRAHFFFGRTSEIEQCLTRLGGTDGGYRRWLQIDGPSGAGKSSLARAGIVPAIRRNRITNGPKRWLTAVFRPGNQPLENLAESVVLALQPIVPSSVLPPQAVEDLCSAETRLRRVLRYSPDGYGFLLVIDQLEEIFTLQVDSDERRRFDQQLADALDDRDGPLHLLSTIRSDFASRLELLPQLADRLNQRASRFFLKPMDASKLDSAIAGPLRLAGLGWEGDLPQRLVGEVEGSDGALPLLSHALEMLWRERTSDGDLTLASLNSLGGVAGALAGKADSVIDGLSTRDRERARRGLLELVQIGRGHKDVRRPRSRQQVLSAIGGEDAEQVLARLSGGRDPESPPLNVPPRLVTVSRSGDDSHDRVDLIHEALLEHWPRLRDWIEEDRRVLELRQDLSAARHAWQKAGCSQDGLPAGAQLAYYRGETLEAPQARDFRQRMDDDSKRFLEQASSRELRRSRRFRAFLAALVALLVISVAAAWWALTKGQEAAKNLAIAKDRQEKALQVAHTINFTIDRRLQDLAGATQIRRDLLDDASELLATLRADGADLDDPETIRQSMVAHSQRGDVALRLEDLEAANQEYESALQLALRLVEAPGDNPLFKNDLAVSYSKLGDLAKAAGDLALARRHFQQVLDIAQQLAQADPQNSRWKRDLAFSYSKLGDLAKAAGDLALARRHFQQALDIAQQLAQAAPQNSRWKRDLSRSYSKLGDLAKAAGDSALARRHFQQALDIGEQLAQADPQNSQWKRDLSLNYERLGDLAKAAGDLALARRHFQQVLDIREQLAQADPQNSQWKRDLSLSYSKLGDLAKAAGDLALARRHFQQALDIREQLAQADPQNSQLKHDLSLSYERLGDLATAAGDLALARRHFQQALDIREQLAQADPQNSQWKRDLSLSYERLGLLALEENNLEGAQKWLDLGLATVEEIIAIAGDHPELEKTRLVKLLQLVLLAARKKDGNAIQVRLKEMSRILERFEKEGLFSEDAKVQSIRALFERIAAEGRRDSKQR